MNTSALSALIGNQTQDHVSFERIDYAVELMNTAAGLAEVPPRKVPPPSASRSVY